MIYTTNGRFIPIFFAAGGGGTTNGKGCSSVSVYMCYLGGLGIFRSSQIASARILVQQHYVLYCNVNTYYGKF